MAVRVAVVGTGGTIASKARFPLDLYEYADHAEKMEADDLIGVLESPGKDIEIVPVRFGAISSGAMTPSGWLRLLRTVDETVRREPGLAGIVVTHGTASLEETAYFLHLTAKVSVPIVVTGSQRPAGAASSDASLNLINAVRVAASPEAWGLGTLVVFNDEIQCAREVTKRSNWRLHAFQTPDFGILGSVDPDGMVAIYRKPIRCHAPDTEFDVVGLKDLPRVDIVYSYVGADGALITAATAAGAQGIVLAGNPPGRPTALQRRALEQAASEEVRVVFSSRAGSGRVIPRIRDKDYGFVSGDNLSPQKARILTMLAITRGPGGNFQRFFNIY